MAHWAEVDENNVVLRVTVGNNDHPDEGHQWLIDNLGGTWIKTSYNASENGFRKNYAGIGYTYNETLDAFIPIKSYPSWTLNEETCQWEAPTPYPQDENDYTWNESTLSWDLVE